MKPPTKLIPKSREGKSREGRSREQRLQALIRLAKTGVRKPRAA
jgi:hypothetical protein